MAEYLVFLAQSSLILVTVSGSLCIFEVENYNLGMLYDPSACLWGWVMKDFAGV